MLQTAGAFCARLSREYIPNPFIFAIILSVVVYLLGIALTDSGPFQMVEYWYGGFWNLLSFAMQMVVILLFGHVLASSPPALRIIGWAARLPNSAGQAIVLITVLAVVFGFISWGLGLIIGAIAAKEVCLQAKRRGIKVHYPLAAAAGFSGLIIFNCGFSASAPLLVNTEGHFLADKIGLIPIAETIFTPYNLIVITAFLLIIPLVYRAMHPAETQTEEVSDEPVDTPQQLPFSVGTGDAATAMQRSAVEFDQLFQISPTGVMTAAPTEFDQIGSEQAARSFAERLEQAQPLSWLVAVAGLSYLGYHFTTKGFDLNLNIVNFTLLILGLIAYKTPTDYVEAIDDGIRSCGQIVLQFPFYAGIMGMMASSGLVSIFAESLVAASNQYTFPLMTLISSAITNLFVPSAGGQWAVQGPLLIEAAQKIGADIGVTVMAFSYGDQLTNGIQPMWMLPLLGVTALKAREILGYTAVMMMVAFVIFGVGVTILPLLFT
ncbi:short-chain fatty acid transporter [Pseudomonas sp. CC6-YY-74]|uniref:short-chain fatty acid transporter n=1 Tax=Pseudomonas sp. CC6-YY-74 TaxID=1930532 RepID=UPI0009A19832|nr:TIGR00366 family protein [Pseudomonas sp. CC6-YY-74]